MSKSQMFSSGLLTNVGIFGAEDGEDMIKPAATAASEGGVASGSEPTHTDGTATVVVNQPGAAEPATGGVIPTEDPGQLEVDGDIVLITDPDDDEAEEIADGDDDDDAADIDGGVEMLSASLDRIGQQCDAIDAINQYGVDPLTVGILMRHGLLSETALGGMSQESFTDTFVGSSDSVMSQEALANLAADAGKALTGAGKAAASKAGDIGEVIIKKFTSVSALVSKAVSTAEKSAEAALDGVAHADAAGMATAAKKVGTGTTKDTVAAGAGMAQKAASHLNAKNAILAVTAAVAVAGGLKMLLGSVPAPTAAPEAKTSFFQKVVAWVRGIKLPWAKLDVTEAGKLTVNGTAAGSATTAAEQAASKSFISGPAGWTKETVASAKAQIAGLSEKISGAFGGLNGKFNSLLGAGESAGKAASDQVGKSGGSAALSKAAGVFAHGSYVAGVLAILALIASVIYFVVVGGLRLVRKSAQGQ